VAEWSYKASYYLPLLGHRPYLFTSHDRRRQFPAIFVYILRHLFT